MDLSIDLCLCFVEGDTCVASRATLDSSAVKVFVNFFTSEYHSVSVVGPRFSWWDAMGAGMAVVTTDGRL